MTTEQNNYNMKIFVIALLALNLLFSIYVAFFKRDAIWLETLKAGGAENMQLAKQLYTSPAYIQQQKSTLDQILGSMNQAGQQPAVDITTQPEVQSGVQPTPAQ